jgi:hypothetical protein
MSNLGHPTGVGKGGFALSEEEKRAGVGDVPIRKTVHPEGEAGTHFSLQEMTKAIKGDLQDPRTVALLRGWAGRALVKGGNPTGETAQAQVLLDELRKRTVYVQDPINTEMIVKPKTTLCLEDGKLCIPAADCDDRVVAFVALCMCVGIDCRIVAQAFGTDRATHVIAAINDVNPRTGGWKRVDPSAKNWPVGKSHPATKEWWVDPTSGSMSLSANGEAVSLGKEPDHGDYIGVGAIPMPHGYSPLTHGAAYTPIGIETGEVPGCYHKTHNPSCSVCTSRKPAEPPSGGRRAGCGSCGTPSPDGTPCCAACGVGELPIGLGDVAEVERICGMGQYTDTTVVGPGGTSSTSENGPSMGPTQAGSGATYQGTDSLGDDLSAGVDSIVNGDANPAIDQASSTIMWIAIAAGAVAAVVLVGPIVWEAVLERNMYATARRARA